VRRGLLLGTLALLAVLVPGAASAAQSDGLRLVEAGKSDFPARSYVLTLPKRTPLAIGQVSVTENGQDVSRLSVVPAGAAGKQGFGTLLVIDASKSMAGRPIEGAMAAARAFAGRRNRNQQLGVMLFNSETNVLVPFTTDGAEIASGLARTPSLAQGTRIYDAIDASLSLIDRAGLKVGTIVLLSDGDDVGSKLDPNAVTARLRDSTVRVFSVGLRSGAFQSSALQGLAQASGGTYTVASTSSSLAGIYDALGFRLANEYLVNWLSMQGPGKRVQVKVDVAGYGTAATAGYRTPALEREIAAPVNTSTIDRIMQSWITMLVFVMLIVALVIFALSTFLRKPGESLQLRLSQYVTLSSEEKERKAELRQLLGQKARSESSVSSWRWWQAFKEDVELADIQMPAGRIALWTAVLGLVLGLLFVLITGSGLAIVFGAVAALITRMYVKIKLRRKRAAFAEQLPDNLEVLASALRAGHSLVGAMSVVVDDAPEPSRTEFRRVIADEQLGVPLDDALGRTVQRMENKDLDQVALVASLQRDTGGNSAEVLDQVVENIRNRMELRRLIKTLTAQGRMARWIVSLLPVALFFAIWGLNPTYIRPLWAEMPGQAFLFMGIIMVIAGSLVIKKIIDIKV
jgi:tight adherence protein B